MRRRSFTNERGNGDGLQESAESALPGTKTRHAKKQCDGYSCRYSADYP